jgi:predicted phosphodiesterase
MIMPLPATFVKSAAACRIMAAADGPASSILLPCRNLSHPEGWMRVAVLSDIHGFSLALDTVQADMAEQGPFDEVVVAGDLCVVGPDPQGVVDRIQRAGWTAIQGNTDYDLVEAAEWATGLDELGYWVDNLTEDAMNFVAMLPFSRRIMPSGGTGPAHELLVVHANPDNLNDQLNPRMTDRELREIIGDEDAGTIAFGHIHIAYIRHVAGTLLVDVSAVGNPKDGDLRCKYGILNWDANTQRWTAEIRRLEYPLEETEAQIRASGLPNPEKAIRKLRKASYSDA